MTIKLRDMHVGDRYPFHYIKIWEYYIDANGDLQKRALDLTADYSSIKYSARSPLNKQNKDDHTLSDINGDMTVTVANKNICHYEWGASDLTDAKKVGTWTVKIVLTRQADSRVITLAETFEFDLRHKHPKGLSDLT